MFKTRRTEIDKIIRDIDVPVHELSFRDYKQFLIDRCYYIQDMSYLSTPKNQTYIAGEYCRVNEYIFVYKYLCNSAKAWVILHEYGHRLCFKNKCSCTKYESSFWRDYHATKYSFEECYRRDLPAAAFDYMCQAVASCQQDIESMYSKIYIRLMKSKLWNRMGKKWGWSIGDYNDE